MMAPDGFAILSAFGALGAAAVAVSLAVWGRPRLPSGLFSVYLVSLAAFLLRPLVEGFGVPLDGAAPVLFALQVLGNTALAAFAVTYGRSALAGRERWRVLWAVIPGVLVSVSMLAAPARFFGPNLVPTELAQVYGRFLHNFAALVGIVSLGARYFAAPQGPHRRAILYALLAFVGFGANHVFADAAQIAGVETAFGSDAPSVVALTVLNAVAIVVVALAVARRAVSSRDANARAAVAGVAALAILASLQLVAHGSAFALHQLLDTAIVALVAYAVARGYVLDIDLKLKWTLRRGTLVGIFLAGFFVAFGIAEQYLQRHGLVVGGVAVGLLVFALRPIERAIDRVADAAMPRVADTHEYRLVRKREVYRAALEEALVDGALTQKDRAVLAALQDQLGLTAMEAHAIEAEASPPGAG